MRSLHGSAIVTPDRIFETIEHFTGYTELGLGPQAIATLLCRDRKLVSYGVRKVDSLVLMGDVETVRVLVCARLRLRERERTEQAA